MHFLGSPSTRPEEKHAFLGLTFGKAEAMLGKNMHFLGSPSTHLKTSFEKHAFLGLTLGRTEAMLGKNVHFLRSPSTHLRDPLVDPLINVTEHLQ